MGRSTRRQAKASAWSYIAGEKGANRVRAYERADRGGALWIDYRDEDGTRHRLPLGVEDREQAKTKADEIAARFRRDGTRRPAELTLAGLIEIYEREVTPGKGAHAQVQDRRAFELFLQFFGRGRKPATLSRRDWDAYIAARRSGRLKPPKARSGGVRDCMIAHDLVLLNAVLNWAVQAGDGRGSYLLERNPLKGLPLPREASPHRAILTPEQYERVRTAAAKSSARLECFVVLAWLTGHRAGSIRHLRWSDVDLEKGRIHWRGESDKIGLDHWNPLLPEAVAILKRERIREPAIGDAWIFPSAKEASRPRSAYAVTNQWLRLAAAAGIPIGERYGWHSFRRAFANRLRRAPLRDLQDLGGWKTSATLLNVYLRADEGAQREALEQHAPTTRAAAQS